MPKPPVPPSVDALLRHPNAAVMASTRPDGSPHSVATWYDWENGRVLLNMDASRVRVKYLQERPAVALTVLDEQSWYKHVSLIGRIVDIHDDVGLVDIDRLARRYTGSAYPERMHRRVSMWMALDVWHGWDATGAIATHADWKP